MASPKETRPFLLRQICKLCNAGLLALALLSPGATDASVVSDELQNAQLRGTATFRFLGVPLYNAKLFTPNGAPFSWDADFGLELTYRKNLTQKALINSTLEEMQRQSNPAPTRAQLAQCFQAVSKGDTYLAISQGPDNVGFWRNGRKTCTLSYAGAKRGFMSIFLGENSRSAAFTQQLKGQ